MLIMKIINCSPSREIRDDCTSFKILTRWLVLTYKPEEVGRPSRRNVALQKKIKSFFCIKQPHLDP